uniref:Mannose-binding lectin-associated serine protease 1 n=1 Tax=Eptatretus burgeri TaxID=7764 RepID=Q5DVT1_EPTBU|nr:mannose-binding lectin-associated serine protease 1 [Eptatretus burgeri]
MMNQTRFIYFFLVSWLFVLGCFSTGDDEVVPKTKQQLFGTLRSPNYPYVYPNFLQRTWHLQVPNGYRVQIKFLHFDLEPSHLCEYDAIELLDGQHILGTFCGKYDTDTERVPGSQPILAPGNILTIKFRSDYSNEEDFTGFVALYTAVDIDECVEFANDEERSCDHFCQNYPGGFFCSCRHGYHLHDNNRTCTVHCNNIIYNGRQGEIFSPEYPHPYPGELRCHVRIVLPEGLHPSIHFEDTFDVENHPEIDGCPFDSLTIRSGGELFGPFCGTHPPKDIQALSNEVDIEFHTDSSGQHNGWAFSYMAQGEACPMPLAPLNGSLFPHQENYFFTDQVIFTCNSGFELVKESGEKVRTLQLECQSSGTWSSLFPTCQPLDCGPPPPLENGRYDGDNSTTFLSSVTYSCNTPYYYLRSQANATQYVCNEMSKWISAEGQKELPSCMPVCGSPQKQRPQKKARIFAGSPSIRGAWPWLASIQKFGRSYCAASLLGSRWLLTAAHCCLPKGSPVDQQALQLSNIYVTLGKHYTWRPTTSEKKFDVSRMVIHPEFNQDSLSFDLALIELESNVIMTDYIMPICLPNSRIHELTKPGSMLMVAGWGKYNESYIAKSLMEAEVPIVEHHLCRETYAAHSPDHAITSDMMCAGFDQGGRDTCQGDSGGPLMVKDHEKKKWVLAGVVSWGKGCGEAYSYGIYANVWKSFSWIKSVTGINYEI